MAESTSKRALAAEVWRRLFDLLMSTRAQREQVLQRFGLTPNDSRALHTLDTTKGTPMRALAREWGTDASAATWVIDRLEAKGLVERRTTAEDRRVKLVVLTARGAKVRDEILKAFHEPPPSLLALDRQELAAFRELLESLATDADA